MRRIAVVIVIAAGACGLGYLGGLSMPHAAEDSAPAPATSTYASSPAARRIFAAGFVEATAREVELRFEVTGRLKSLSVSEGDSVKAEQVIATIDAELFELQLEEAQAQYQLAQAERERLTKGASPESRKAARAAAKAAESVLQDEGESFNQVKAGFAKGTVNQERLDLARTRYGRVIADFNALRLRADQLEAAASAEEIQLINAKLAHAETRIRTADAMLKKCELKSPTSGIAIRVRAAIGELVGSQSPALLQLVDHSVLRVRAYVEEFDAERVTVGQSASITTAATKSKPIKGRVVWCSPQVAPKEHLNLLPGERRDLRMREILIELPSDSGLLVGLPVEVLLVATNSASARS